MAVTNTPTTTTQGALPTNQFPAPSIYPPAGSGQLVLMQGGAIVGPDSNGNYYAPVVFASNPTSTAALTSVAGATSSTSLLASNANRKTYSVYNDGSANMYIALGATASLTAYTVKLPPNSLYESPGNPCWQGAVSMICDSATGNARITEVS